MVQLPATAAIEYVAACCRTRTRTRTKTGTKTNIGTITKTVRGAYARSPQVQCLYAPSRLSYLRCPNFQGMWRWTDPDILHPSTIWVRPLFTELGPKNPHFAKKRTNICRLSRDINEHLSITYMSVLDYSMQCPMACYSC